MDQVISWFADYGYWILFIGLLLEFLFLPFPGGTVMGFSGVLSHQGELTYWVCVFLAGTGASLGMAITYFIGLKLGAPFFEKYGSKFFMGPKRFQAVQKWFNRFGNKVVFISFFVPGIRHFTGYFSGIMKLNFKLFLFYTLGGAFSWAITCVTLGYFLGPKWESIIRNITANLLPFAFTIIGVVLIYICIKWFQKIRVK